MLVSNNSSLARSLTHVLTGSINWQAAKQDASKADAAKASLTHVIAEQTKALWEQRRVIEQTFEAMERLQAAMGATPQQ
jgi:hypothetical protein